MKKLNTRIILPIALFIGLILIGCERNDSAAEQARAEMPDTKLTARQQAQLVRDWQVFRAESSARLDTLNAIIHVLESRSVQKYARPELRKKVRSWTSRHDQLFDRLQYKSLRFVTRVKKYSERDRLKNESFRIQYKSELDALAQELDLALVENNIP
ncbi:MAG: hypothetical protein EOO51_08890 [Flavobacterium sp.]|nr:MAG: hypothetical protein EOO51_08890 [Flavobacterium sp.]